MSASLDMPVGFVLGVLASLAAAAVFHWWSQRAARLALVPLLGDYPEGYGFLDEKANPLVQQPTPQSKARLRHLRANALEIRVWHGDRTWTGRVLMETPEFGTLVWGYDDLELPKHSFGYKRLLVRKSEQMVLLYLLGEVPFGREVFIKRS